MRVGIITIIDNLNYGNRLQNYAVQEVVKSLGMSVETINNHPDFSTESYSNTNVKEMKIHEILILVKKKIQYEMKKNKTNTLNKRKYRNFEKFTNEYIEQSNLHINNLAVPENINTSYDYFITGSDQVWNPHHRKGYPIDFLSFAEYDQRIAYAPSFGVSEIPERLQPKYKSFLNGMKNLSVRENAGADIIKSLTGRDVEVLIDPTLMLDRNQWGEISKPSEYKPQNDYVLTYFLGKQDKKVLNKLKNYAKENNLEMVNLANVSYSNYYCVDPSEFIDFIKSSSIVFTDSFHGVVFSIIFKKPFIIFKRGKMNSRIDTLLEKFSLENRKWENIKEIETACEIDYSNIPDILRNERNRALKYLLNAFNIEKAN